jgi:hypothetical protein
MTSDERLLLTTTAGGRVSPKNGVPKARKVVAVAAGGVEGAPPTAGAVVDGSNVGKWHVPVGRNVKCTSVARRRVSAENDVGENATDVAEMEPAAVGGGRGLFVAIERVVHGAQSCITDINTTSIFIRCVLGERHFGQVYVVSIAVQPTS